MTTLRERDPADARLAHMAPGLLATFNDAGVLTAADIQVARRLAAIAGEEHPIVLLAAALAVRAPRLGHVLVDMSSISVTAAVDTEEPVDLPALPWPETGPWLKALTASPLVHCGDDPAASGDSTNDRLRPLRLVGDHLYLERYWREERAVASDLLSRGATAPSPDIAALVPALQRLFPDMRSADQRAAAAAAVSRRLTVVAGGPGTGKTATVARIAALVLEEGPTRVGRPPLIALAAPTGKAAARLEEAVHHEARQMDTGDDIRVQLTGLGASTLHRLLGARQRSRTRFRYDRFSRLPHDVVIIDEASMMSLTLTSRLLEAVRPDARLVLVGDPGQLASVEAGAVLGDVVAAAGPDGSGLPAVVALREEFRYGEAISAVARAVREGDADATVAALSASATGDGPVLWINADPAESLTALEPVRLAAVIAGRAMIGAARGGRRRDALNALAGFRLVCAHRRGPYGVSTWMPRVEAWLADDIDLTSGRADRYPGRPLLVTANDYDLELFNGDTGVIVLTPDGSLKAAFERRGQVVDVSPARLSAVESVHAMTVHKSQGSQFRTTAVIVPPVGSRLLTRELLYTAVTRARERLIVVGPEAAIRAAVHRPIARASGLVAALNS
jgi:exodeoxyribonuclease V alpha subunit